MSDANTSNGPKNVDYSSNSKAAKKTPAEERPVVQAVVPVGAATVRKKGVGAKLREQFVGDSAQSVGQYLLLEVLMPATKNLIFDLGREGLQRLLFGGSRPASSVVSSVVGGVRTSYSSFSKPAQGPQTTIMPTPGGNEAPRNVLDFSGVVLPSREDCVKVLDVLSDLIESYGQATLNDFYACIGQTTDFTTVRYGWQSLGQAHVRPVREGYYLELPRPTILPA